MSSTSVAPGGGPVNDGCIRCHASTYNQGLDQQNLHLPFFERQCTACHLTAASAAATLESSSTQAGATTTGTLVDQEPHWTRRTVLTSTDGRGTREHLVVANGLEAGTSYRFRIVVGPRHDSAVERISSPWLGLQPGELQGLPSAEVSSLALAAAENETIRQATLQETPDHALLISWQTPVALLGEVQLEEMAGPEPATTTAAESHLELLTPEELAVDVCFTCHPATHLGTSHPVQVYASGEIRIPAELPTVDGMVTCVTCHDPHGSGGKMLVRELIVTKLCVACHQGFRNSSRATLFD